jgi:hypothetical protein
MSDQFNFDDGYDPSRHPRNKRRQNAAAAIRVAIVAISLLVAIVVVGTIYLVNQGEDESRRKQNTSVAERPRKSPSKSNASSEQPPPADPKFVEFQAGMKRFIDEATSLTRAMELLPDRALYRSRTAGVQDAYSRIPDPPGRDEKLAMCHKAARQITVDFEVGDLQLHLINEFLRLGSTANAEKSAQQFRELASSQKAKLRELEAAVNERRVPRIELSDVIRGQ